MAKNMAEKISRTKLCWLHLWAPITEPADRKRAVRPRSGIPDDYDEGATMPRPVYEVQ